MANFGEAAELACVGAARRAALLAFGADPETAAPAERRGKGLAKAFASPRADFCLKQTALPCLEADVSVAAARLAAFPGDKPSAETLGAARGRGGRRRRGGRAAAARGATRRLRSRGPGRRSPSPSSRGALVAAVVAAWRLGPRRRSSAAVAIAADAALSVAVEADGTRLPEVRVPAASS